MSAQTKNSGKIKNIFITLDNYFGDLHWWPAQTPFEVMVGAVLTQNTSWVNVEKAIRALKQKKLMSPEKLLVEKNLPEIIRASGFHGLKSKRLKALCMYLTENSDRTIEVLKRKKTELLRSELLGINGIGPETADAILLYALEKPVFVVDNYTKRIMSRHGIVRLNDDYSQVQEELGRSFSKNIKKLKQYHAVLVETAKRFCKKNSPLCEKCPLGKMYGTGEDSCSSSKNHKRRGIHHGRIKTDKTGRGRSGV